MHQGQDFAANDGTPIYAAADSVVEYIGEAQGFGQWIVLRHNGTGESSVYGHMWNAFATGLREGQPVDGGKLIAYVGSNGESTGPHLHFEIHPGKWQQGSQIDPLPWLSTAQQPEGDSMPAPRPDFNEYPVWSPNYQPRNGTTIDLFILHTTEGEANADSLAHGILSNPAPGGDPKRAVSYHYSISQDYRDNGVTACDVVDTDMASWSVLSANNRSINLVFAGSYSGWSRDQWMKQSRAIDVAAYLAVQDCRKYKIPLTVIRPPYGQGRAGITDHNYVGKVLGDGDHSDVGPNFPWDYFTQRVQFWSNPIPAPAPPPPPKPGPVPPSPTTDRQLLESMNAKLDKLLAK